MTTRIKPHDVFRMRDGSKVVVIHAANRKVLFAPTFNQSRMSEISTTKFAGQIAEKMPKLDQHWGKFAQRKTQRGT